MPGVREDPTSNGRTGGQTRQRRIKQELARLRALDGAGLRYQDILDRAAERKAQGVDDDALCAAVLVDGAAGVGDVDDVRIRAARSHFAAQREIRAGQEALAGGVVDRASRFAALGLGGPPPEQAPLRWEGADGPPGTAPPPEAAPAPTEIGAVPPRPGAADPDADLDPDTESIDMEETADAG